MGSEGRQVLAGCVEHAGHEAARRPGAAQEDPRAPWPAPLLGPSRARSAHEDDRPQGPHRRCVQEEGLVTTLVLTSSARGALVGYRVVCRLGTLAGATVSVT